MLNHAANTDTSQACIQADWADNYLTTVIGTFIIVQSIENCDDTIKRWPVIGINLQPLETNNQRFAVRSQQVT